MSEKMRHDTEPCSARRSGRVGLERLQGILGVAREPTVMVNQVRRPDAAAVSCSRHRRCVAGLQRLHLGRL